jgi:multiple sugar transport system ATP-binding protein
MARVRFDSVSKVYGDGTRAVDSLDLEVADGEFMVLVGPSGCGKTTALRMVAGLEDISEGELSIGDRVVNDLEPRDRDVAMVFQSYALYPHMTVYDNIAFGLKMRKETRGAIRERVAEISRVLGLTDLLEKRPRQLSGGQRQRVAMGRAIVRQPEVFLMDEPLSNLDARLRVQMRAEIARIQRELSATTIYVTHDQVEAMTMGDRVAVLRKGELQQTDEPQTVYDRPANLFVATFIGSPAMGLVEGDLARDGDGLKIRIGPQEVTVPETVAEGRPALPTYAGKQVAVGLRPEHLEDAALVGGEPARLRGEVLFAESLGSERLVHVAVEGKPVITDEVLEIAADADQTAVDELRHESQERRPVLLARLDAASRAAVGGEIALAVRPERMHFFDLETGAAIYD